jgi:hypothetical protein
MHLRKNYSQIKKPLLHNEST